jgi:signal transduction histidine kinase
MRQITTLLRNRHFWIIVVMLIICAFFHYFSPQFRLQPLASYPLSRQAVVRIIFLLPMAAAAFAFGRIGGLTTLALGIVIMLPRVLFVSDEPIDAFFETLGVAVVGYIVVWMIETQEKEKSLRQKAVEELETVNAIALTLSEPYDLDAMLDKALREVLEAVGSEWIRGAIFLIDPWGQMLILRAHKGLPPEFIERAGKVPLSECLCGVVAESGELMIVEDALVHSRHTRCPEPEPHAHVCVPLRSKDRLLGVMDVHLPATYHLDAIDREMFAAIGRQIGVAVENARLCEKLRFYVMQVTGAQEDERRRIARELHDDTAQNLIDLSRRLDDLATVGEGLPEAAGERIERLQQRIEDVLQGVRRFSRDLRPTVLDDLGLLPALEGQLVDLDDHGIEWELNLSGERRRLPQDVELGLFRIVQEALNNIKRHSQASRVTISVGFDGDQVRVRVQDDGQGFELLGSTSDLAAMGRFGLVGIEERTQLLGGHFVVQSELGEGTMIGVDVPG